MDRYEEALERAKAGKPMDEVFPELKESEDERIRKEIIFLLKHYNSKEEMTTKYPIESMIAYLEKQKECSFCDFPKSCADCPKEIQAAIDKEFGIDGRDDNDNPLNGYGDWKEGMVLNGPAIWGLVKLGIELQKEQKPNECNTHEPTLDEARKWNEAYEKGYSLGYENGRNEQNPEEFSEDERIRKELIEELKSKLPFCSEEFTKHRIIRQINYLEKQKYEYEVFEPVESTLEYKIGFNAGKESIQKAEWSEEDKEALREVKLNFELNHDNMTPTLVGFYERFFNKLKSLRPQPHWKPSEDEITAIEVAVKYLLAHTPDEQLRKNVISVFEHLKQL